LDEIRTAIRDAARCSPIKWNILQVYVSHSMEAVKKTCERAIWLEHGEIRAEGEAGLAVEDYLKAQG